MGRPRKILKGAAKQANEEHVKLKLLKLLEQFKQSKCKWSVPVDPASVNRGVHTNLTIEMGKPKNIIRGAAKQARVKKVERKLSRLQEQSKQSNCNSSVRTILKRAAKQAADEKVKRALLGLQTQSEQSNWKSSVPVVPASVNRGVHRNFTSGMGKPRKILIDAAKQARVEKVEHKLSSTRTILKFAAKKVEVFARVKKVERKLSRTRKILKRAAKQARGEKVKRELLRLQEQSEQSNCKLSVPVVR